MEQRGKSGKDEGDLSEVEADKGGKVNVIIIPTTMEILSKAAVSRLGREEISSEVQKCARVIRPLVTQLFLMEEVCASSATRINTYGMRITARVLALPRPVRRLRSFAVGVGNSTLYCIGPALPS